MLPGQRHRQSCSHLKPLGLAAAAAAAAAAVPHCMQELRVVITSDDGSSKAYPAVIAAADAMHDLAVLECSIPDSTAAPPLAVGTSEDLKVSRRLPHLRQQCSGHIPAAGASPRLGSVHLGRDPSGFATACISSSMHTVFFWRLSV
jgi:hypothetical protein